MNAGDVEEYLLATKITAKTAVFTLGDMINNN